MPSLFQRQSCLEYGSNSAWIIVIQNHRLCDQRDWNLKEKKKCKNAILMPVTGLRVRKGWGQKRKKGWGLKHTHTHTHVRGQCRHLSTTILWHFPCQPDLSGTLCKIASDECDFSDNISVLHCTFCISGQLQFKEVVVFFHSPHLCVFFLHSLFHLSLPDFTCILQTDPHTWVAHWQVVQICAYTYSTTQWTPIPNRKKKGLVLVGLVKLAHN